MNFISDITIFKDQLSIWSYVKHLIIIKKASVKSELKVNNFSNNTQLDKNKE